MKLKLSVAVKTNVKVFYFIQILGDESQLEGTSLVQKGGLASDRDIILIDFSLEIL